MRKTCIAALAFALLLSISTCVLAESKVLLYTSVPLELATSFADQFMKTNKGVKVEVFRAGSTDVVNKIWAESEAGGVRADVIWLADAAAYYTFKDKGLLYAYKSPEAALVPPALGSGWILHRCPDDQHGDRRKHQHSQERIGAEDLG